jgi:hypothetical protein
MSVKSILSVTAAAILSASVLNLGCSKATSAGGIGTRICNVSDPESIQGCEKGDQIVYTPEQWGS